MTTGTKAIVSRRDLRAAIQDQYLEAASSGDHWHYVRVWPDGTVTRGAEPSRCIPEAEYYRKGNPYPVTAWSIYGIKAGPEESIYEWEECPESEAEFWSDEAGNARGERDERHDLPRKLDREHLRDELEWDTILPEVERQLEEAGYTVEE